MRWHNWRNTIQLAIGRTLTFFKAWSVEKLVPSLSARGDIVNTGPNPFIGTSGSYKPFQIVGIRKKW
jgi:hypothetical protein